MGGEMFDALTDDQIALMGCFAALLATGSLMSVSYYLGRGSRLESPRPSAGEADVLSLPRTPAAGSDTPHAGQSPPHKRAA